MGLARARQDLSSKVTWGIRQGAKKQRSATNKPEAPGQNRHRALNCVHGHVGSCYLTGSSAWGCDDLEGWAGGAGGRETREVADILHLASQMALVVKNPPASAGDKRDSGSIPGWRRPSGGGHGNPPQHSRLESPMDRGAWWATVHRVAKSRTRLNQHSVFAGCMTDSHWCMAETNKTLYRDYPPNENKTKQQQLVLQTVLGFLEHREPYSDPYMALLHDTQSPASSSLSRPYPCQLIICLQWLIWLITLFLAFHLVISPSQPGIT